MSKAPRKSIIANFASFGSGSQTAQGQAVPPVPPSAGPSTQRVGASVIGATQRSLSELREERDRLQALVSAGGTREINPELVDPSPFRDRMPDDNEADFEGFRTLFAEKGQKVPVELRPHPEGQGRFQIVYGHRRWRAARELGVPLRAIIVNKNDAEVAVSQGIENAARQDLSWIERASFAATMERAGIKARDIRAAMNIDDGELARFRAVLRTVPEDVIRRIGRAPKAGRPRWVEFTRLATNFPDRLVRLTKTLADAKIASSDERFRSALSALRGEGMTTATGIDLQDGEGRVVAKAVLSRGSLRLTAERGLATELDEFLREELPQLAQRFTDWRDRRDNP